MLRRVTFARTPVSEEWAVYTRLFMDFACAAAFTGAVAAIAFLGIEDRHAVSVLLALCTILVV